MQLHKILGIILTADSLSEYTTYYWYIEVSDGKATTTSEKQSAKTKCSGATLDCTTSSCPGTTVSTCTNCTGTGTVTYECSNYNTLCELCEMGVQACSGPFTSIGSTGNQCGHGDDYTLYQCDSCGYEMAWAPCYDGPITHWRTKCTCRTVNILHTLAHMVMIIPTKQKKLVLLAKELGRKRPTVHITYLAHTDTVHIITIQH